jgi:hypothetical protein
MNVPIHSKGVDLLVMLPLILKLSVYLTRAKTLLHAHTRLYLGITRTRRVLPR